MNDTIDTNAVIIGVVSELERIRRDVHHNNNMIMEHEVIMREQVRKEQFEDAALTRDEISRLKQDSLAMLAHVKRLVEEYYDVEEVINKAATIPESKK